MDTALAILISQGLIVLVGLIALFEFHRFRKTLEKIIKKAA
jgi:hypothetical protein